MYYKLKYTNSTVRIPEFVIEPEIALELLMAAVELLEGLYERFDGRSGGGQSQQVSRRASRPGRALRRVGPRGT